MPYLKGKTPRWLCPGCGVIIANESWYWITFDILAHIRAGHKQTAKDDGKQKDLSGKKAMVPLKKGSLDIVSSQEQLLLTGKGGVNVSYAMEKERVWRNLGRKGSQVRRSDHRKAL